MKSRHLILVPIILLAQLLIPVNLLGSEFVDKPKPTVPPATAEDQAEAEAVVQPAPPERPAEPDETPPVELVEISPISTPLPEYTTAPPSRDGIGKIFMGREISHVMGHPGIGWLERNEREKEEAPSKAIAMLGLAPDDVIADIGAGSGYYSFRIAPLVPKGKVVAVDIQQEMLDHLKAESKKLGIENVEPHLGTIKSIQLPPNTLDAALMVDAYHEFSHPAEMLTSLRTALKPGGKIYLLEYRAEDPKVPIKTLHKMTAAQAIKEYEALGFTFVENKTGLPWQHLLIFEKPQPSTSNPQ